MGPLQGIRVLEIEAIGPVPWSGMMLSDMGADVLRIDRPVPAQRLRQPADRFQIANRGKRAMVADLKTAAGVQAVLRLVAEADILIEGMRPGVMERLGIGPQECLRANPRLVYGRMTGWGQTGPLAQKAGHDINYIALAGLLHAVGERGRAPVVPLNLIGDYGGGGMLLALGVCAALLHSRATGHGQVVDAAMIDGAGSLMAPLFGQLAAGAWRDERGSNPLDGGAPWYGVYETADARHMAVGAVEPQFYEVLVRTLGLAPEALPAREDPANWQTLRELFAERFSSRSQAEWIPIFAERDACVSPVLTLEEATGHEHQQARAGFVEIEGVAQPAPAPRFSRTPTRVAGPPCGRAGNYAEDQSVQVESIGWLSHPS